jgi:hypothetical protein
VIIFKLRPFYPREATGGWVDPRIDMDFGQGKISLPLLEFEPRFLQLLA